MPVSSDDPTSAESSEVHSDAVAGGDLDSVNVDDGNVDDGNVDGDDHSASRWSRLRNWPRRRKSLVLVGVILVAVGLAVWIGFRSSRSEPIQAPPPVPPAEKFKIALQAVLDGEQQRLYIADYPVTSEMLAQVPVEAWQQAAAEDPNFEPPLDTLLLDQGIVRDQDLPRLTRIPNLHQLRLRLSPISDAALPALLTCKSLWLLNLPHSELTSAGVARLAELPKLRQLRLGGKRLTSDVAKSVAQIRSLRGLHLIGAPINDEGLKLIATLPHLESLYLDDAAVTDSGWQWLFQAHPQLHVHINQQHHDRDPKRHEH